MKRPNVLLITCDQLRKDALGCYGNTVISTPNIDSLSTDGVVFENHFCQTPLCSPSRTTIFTGKYANNHGVLDNGYSLDGKEKTLAEMLKDKGYYTAAIGKMHFVPQLLIENDEDDEDVLWPEGNYGFMMQQLTDDKKTGLYLKELKERSPEACKMALEFGKRKRMEDLTIPSKKKAELAPQLYENHIPSEFSQTMWIAEKTEDFINKHSNDEQPFFLWCSFVDPHHPFDPPKPYDTMYKPEDMPLSTRGEDDEMDDKPPHFKRSFYGMGVSPNERYRYCDITDEGWRIVKAKYYGMITQIDDAVGKVLASLKDKGILEDTIIIFTSDHGDLMGDHRMLFKGGYHYDGLVHVPMMVRYPAGACSSMRTKQMTQHTDILPTILDYLNFEIPMGVQGESMKPILEGKRIPGREYVFIEQDYGDQGINMRTIRSKNWRLTYYANESYGELYDLNKDPDEIHNLYNNEEYYEVRDKLLLKLIDKMINSDGARQKKACAY